MKQYTNNHIRFAEVLTHVIGWGIVFGFPFFIINRGGEAIDWMGYLRHSGVSLSFFIVFYLNYFLLIPRYLFSGRIREYMDAVPSAEYHEGCRGIWSIPCEIALPCATQNELLLEDAEKLIANGVKLVAEGANMPCALDAVAAFQNSGVLYAPGKAANAGGVATSGLEMCQNAMKYSWNKD